MKDDAEQLISKAVKLLKDTSSVAKAKGRTEKHVSSMHQTGEDDDNTEDTVVTATRVMDQQEKTGPEVEKDEIDRSKDASPEQSFWFKLAEQSF